MAGFWDDPELKASSDWVKFDSVGDSAQGTIARLGKKTWQDGSIGIEISFTDDAPSVTASQTLLKQALWALKPNQGDALRITLAAIEKRPGGKTLKRFKVDLRRPDGENLTVDQTDESNGAVQTVSSTGKASAADTPPPF